MTKIKCCKCNKKDAVWLYMPGHDDGNDFFCDDCVPRDVVVTNMLLKNLVLIINLIPIIYFGIKN